MLTPRAAGKSAGTPLRQRGDKILADLVETGRTALPIDLFHIGRFGVSQGSPAVNGGPETALPQGPVNGPRQ